MRSEVLSLATPPQLSKDGALLLDWDDGHQTSLAAAPLRRSCPCALCLEQKKGSPLRVIVEAPAESLRLRRIEQVGNYALTIVWGDGHNTGIYPFRLLRELCECLQCRLDREEANAAPRS